MLTQRDKHAAMGYLIDAHLAHLRASGYSPRTIGARENVLRRLHNHLPYGLAWAETDQIEAWFAAHPHWSRWTRCAYDRHTRAFYGWCDGRYLDGDPTEAMTRPRQPRCIPDPVTDEELRLALEGSPDPWHTIVALGAFGGLRASEIARTDRTDITEHVLLVRTGKGGDPGAVPTHPYLWSLVRARPAGPLVTHHGEPVTGAWLSAHARHHFDRLGLDRVHLHRFRDHFATGMLNAGANIRVVQECLRHASVTSTMGYTQVTGEQRWQAVASLPVPRGPQAGL